MEEGVPVLRVNHVDDFLGVGIVKYVFDFLNVTACSGEYLCAMAAVSLVKSGCIWLIDNYKCRLLQYLCKVYVEYGLNIRVWYE
jgi:hypothetical protein